MRSAIEALIRPKKRRQQRHAGSGRAPNSASRGGTPDFATPVHSGFAVPGRHKSVVGAPQVEEESHEQDVSKETIGTQGASDEDQPEARDLERVRP